MRENPCLAFTWLFNPKRACGTGHVVCLAPTPSTCFLAQASPTSIVEHSTVFLGPLARSSERRDIEFFRGHLPASSASSNRSRVRRSFCKHNALICGHERLVPFSGSRVGVHGSPHVLHHIHRCREHLLYFHLFLCFTPAFRAQTPGAIRRDYRGCHG